MKLDKRTNGLAAALCFGLLSLATTALAQNSGMQTTDRNGNSLTVRSSQPAPVNYGPAPPFEQLDANHDGRISRDEANAYIPLFNDFDYLAHGAGSISRRQFDKWNASQNHQ
jgi:hypothetical protein